MRHLPFQDRANFSFPDNAAEVRPGGFLVSQPKIDPCLQKARWHSVFVLLALVPALLALSSCGGGGSATAVPSITVSGLSGTVIVNGTVQFTASILNLSSTLVNYSVSGTGTGPFGTIDANGLYTAPAAVPVNNVVTITATAQAQSTLTATTTITILAATVINSVVCSNPALQTTYTVASSQSLQCNALDPQSNQVFAVNWLVNGTPGGTPATGLITTQGNYVAPLIPPTGGSVTITAVSQSVSTQTQTVTVTPTYGNAILQGNYAFSTSGKQTANSATFARVGSFVADGNGNLTGGLEDVNPTIYATKPISFTGLYTVGPDGRGTIQFCENTTKACKAATATTQFRFVVRSQQEVRIMDFQSGSAAIGEIVQQPDVSVFNNAGLSGAYSFGFAGPSLASTEESVVGEFVADGDPGSTGTGHITSGEVDVNTGGVSAAAAVAITGGTYQVSANGRGTATLITAGQTYTLAFYLVSASRAKFIETDALPILSGDAFKQQTSLPWGAGALNGSVVFQTRGFAAGNAVADLVSFMADGNGNIVAGSGILDQNSAGTPTSLSSLGGSYLFQQSDAAYGRGTLTIGGHSYVFYMVAPWSAQGSAVIQETTSGVVALGSVIQPQGGPFTNASLMGSYALSLAGQNATPRPEDFVGQLTSNGTDNVTSGSLDINNFGTTQAGVAQVGTYLPGPPAVLPAITLRGTMTLTSGNFVLYLVSPTQFYVLGPNSTGVAVGSIYHQF